MPGLADTEYRRNAVGRRRSLLQAVGETSALGLKIGVGVSNGEEFVGNVGGGGYKDFTALGDVTNTAARLTAGRAGGLLVDAATYEAVADDYPEAGRHDLDLKGKQAPVVSYAIRTSQ